MMVEGLENSSNLRVFSDVAGAIGQTPLVRLHKVVDQAGPVMYAELEMLDPGGSVKDPMALSILDALEYVSTQGEA